MKNRAADLAGSAEHRAIAITAIAIAATVTIIASAIAIAITTTLQFNVENEPISRSDHGSGSLRDRGVPCLPVRPADRRWQLCAALFGPPVRNVC